MMERLHIRIIYGYAVVYLKNQFVQISRVVVSFTGIMNIIKHFHNKILEWLLLNI